MVRGRPASVARVARAYEMARASCACAQAGAGATSTTWAANTALAARNTWVAVTLWAARTALAARTWPQRMGCGNSMGCGHLLGCPRRIGCPHRMHGRASGARAPRLRAGARRASKRSEGGAGSASVRGRASQASSATRATEREEAPRHAIRANGERARGRARTGQCAPLAVPRALATAPSTKPPEYVALRESSARSCGLLCPPKAMRRLAPSGAARRGKNHVLAPRAAGAPSIFPPPPSNSDIATEGGGRMARRARAGGRRLCACPQTAHVRARTRPVLSALKLGGSAGLRPPVRAGDAARAPIAQVRKIYSQITAVCKAPNN